jgi:hypothetical protein
MLRQQASTKVTTECQTDLVPLVSLACELFLNEISPDNSNDQDLMKRLKAIVERILAKCR